MAGWVVTMFRRAILFLVGCLAGGAVAEERPPNVVYIMSDELAYYELGHMGNPYIKTPRIDRMAAEGLRFTRAYAGAPVCAPLRCNLMTGKHAGHASKNKSQSCANFGRIHWFASRANLIRLTTQGLIHFHVNNRFHCG